MHLNPNQTSPQSQPPPPSPNPPQKPSSLPLPFPIQSSSSSLHNKSTPPSSTLLDLPQFKFVTLDTDNSCLQLSTIQRRPFYRKLFNTQQWDLSKYSRLQNLCRRPYLPRLTHEPSLQIYQIGLNHRAQNRLQPVPRHNTRYKTMRVPQPSEIIPRRQQHILNLKPIQNTHAQPRTPPSNPFPDDNHICEVRSLRRLNTITIKLISLRDCKIVAQGFICGMSQLHAPRLQKLFINYRGDNVLEKKMPWIKKTDWVSQAYLIGGGNNSNNNNNNNKKKQGQNQHQYQNNQQLQHGHNHGHIQHGHGHNQVRTMNMNMNMPTMNMTTIPDSTVIEGNININIKINNSVNTNISKEQMPNNNSRASKASKQKQKQKQKQNSKQKQKQAKK